MTTPEVPAEITQRWVELQQQLTTTRSHQEAALFDLLRSGVRALQPEATHITVLAESGHLPMLISVTVDGHSVDTNEWGEDLDDDSDASYERWELVRDVVGEVSRLGLNFTRNNRYYKVNFEDFTVADWSGDLGEDGQVLGEIADANGLHSPVRRISDL